MPGTFSLPPRVSDPDMHHGTCVMHVPWCMPGSLTGGGRESVPCIPRAYQERVMTKKWGRLTCWSPTTSVTSQKRCPVHRSCIRLTKWDELVESSWKCKLPSDSRSGGHDGGEESRDAMAETETEGQWETVLLCNDVSQWLGEYLKSALQRMTRLSLVITRSLFSHLLTQNNPYIAFQGKV